LAAIASTVSLAPLSTPATLVSLVTPPTPAAVVPLATPTSLVSNAPLATPNTFVSLVAPESGEFPDKKRRKISPDAGPIFVSPATLAEPSLSFSQWSAAYRRDPTPKEPPRPSSYAESVESQVKLFYKSVQDIFESTWDDADVFADTIDTWFDEESACIQKSTLASRLRYIRWIGWWKLDQGGTSDDVITFLDETIQAAQSASTRHSTNHSMLAICDPYALVKTGNDVVNLLRKAQRDELDPFISSHLRTLSKTESQLLTFGCEQLRCWLDLAMRFTNIACRIQCTIRLEMPTSTSQEYVSKLVQHGTCYTRVLNKDKVGKHYEATQIPLDSTISTYLSFYLAFCRADASSHLVFQTKRGSPWQRASRDVKKYLKDRGFLPEKVEPNGRFVHGSRHISLATFSVGVGFDVQRIRDYTVLMRHSLDTAEKIYCPWLKVSQAANAIKSVASIRGLDLSSLPEHNVAVADAVKLTGLREPQDIISAYSRQAMSSNFKKQLFVSYGKRSVGTQTYIKSELLAEEEDPAGDLAPGSATQKCSECPLAMDLCGPHAVSRDTTKFGRYYLACRTCKGSTKLWFPLGHVPLEPSTSCKPRNLKSIQEHLLKHCGVVLKLV